MEMNFGLRIEPMLLAEMQKACQHFPVARAARVVAGRKARRGDAADREHERAAEDGGRERAEVESAYALTIEPDAFHEFFVVRRVYRTREWMTSFFLNLLENRRSKTRISRIRTNWIH